MREFTDIDLRYDPLAQSYIKDEVVTVIFADIAGELMSREGPNRYLPGDAIVTGATGDRWVVARERFDAKYLALPPLAAGEAGRYRAQPIPVLARRIDEPFCLRRRAGGDLLQGKPGDWLMQYGPGDWGITEQVRFAAVYRPAP